jgi:zinc protease
MMTLAQNRPLSPLLQTYYTASVKGSLPEISRLNAVERSPENGIFPFEEIGLVLDPPPAEKGTPSQLQVPPPVVTEDELKSLGIEQLASTQLPNGNQVEHYVLKNGHQVYFERRHDNLVSLRTFIRTGSTNENSVYKSPQYQETGFQSGIAHLDEHCHFLTTKNFPTKNEWVENIEAYGVSLNASTSDEEVQHELHFNREDLPSMLQLHAEQVLHPMYEDVNIEQERKNVLNEASERLESSSLRAMDKAFELMLDRPVSYQTLGTRTDVLDTHATDLKRFFDTFYTPTNMITVLSGNVNPADVLPLINKEFGHQVARPAPINDAGLRWSMKPNEIREQTYVDPKLSGLSLVLLGFEGPSKGDKKGRATQEILEAYLTGGELAPLNRHLVDEDHLAMDVSMMSSVQKNTGMSLIMMHSFEGHEQKAANALMKELSQLGSISIDDEKLKDVKKTLIHQHKMSLQHGEDSSYAIGTEALTHSVDYLARYEQYINSITPEEIQAYAQKYFNGKSYALVYALPGEKERYSEKTSNVDGVLPNFTPEAGPALATKQEPSTQDAQPYPQQDPAVTDVKLTPNPPPRLNVQA